MIDMMNAVDSSNYNKTEIPYSTYISNYASHTGGLLMMNYLNCFECIKEKHADADFNDYYNIYMYLVMNQGM